MSKLTLSKRALICAAFSSLAMPVSFAQSSDDDGTIDLETQHIDLNEIVVTASPLARPLGQTIGGVSLLEGEELQERLENSIGETLRSQPGITSTAFGAGASRPIIRGLGGGSYPGAGRWYRHV